MNCADKRDIQDVQDYHAGLRHVRELEVVTYRYLPTSPCYDGRSHVGLIAQAVQKKFPQYIQALPNGHLGVDHSEFVAMLVQAVQELHERMELMARTILDLKLKKGE